MRQRMDIKAVDAGMKAQAMIIPENVARKQVADNRTQTDIT